jgi:mono/diheme cytochrome c family protein
MASCIALVPPPKISNPGDAIVSSRAFVKAAKLSLAGVGIVGGLAIAGASLAQPAADKAAAAKAAAALPATGAPVATDPAVLDKGRMIFTDYGCAQCHSLGDAGATGHVGPSLDGNPNINLAFVTDRVTNGQGMMPSFASQLSPDEIAAVAAYITKVAAK